MSETRKGVLAAIAACFLWGVSGLFYDQLAHVSLWEIMAHRTLWTFVLFLIVLAYWGQMRAPVQVLRSARSFWLIALASAMVAVNWLVFVYAVQIDQALEASLGYFMFPLIAVLMGRLIYAERLTALQSVSVTMVGVAVAVLTYGLGVAPWIALALAISFGAYGFAKKSLTVGPVVSVTAESLLLLPPSAVWLALLHAQGDGTFGQSFQDSVLLILSGPMVAAPLILFSYAASRLSMTTLGFLNYLNPSIQFLAATLIMREPFGLWHASAFALIWTALILYSITAWRQERAVRKVVVSSFTDTTNRR